jgi:predicted nuclease of predicted toxin-antitoxin system
MQCMSREYGLQRALDEEILARAAREQRTLISADMDFGFLMASRRHPWPSVVLLRRLAFHRAEFVVTLLLANLPQLAEALEQGSLVVLEEKRASLEALLDRERAGHERSASERSELRRLAQEGTARTRRMRARIPVRHRSRA